jgi:Flp pilus assembly protein TadD
MVLLAHDVRPEARACLDRASVLAPSDGRWPYYLGIAQLPGAPLSAVSNLQRAVRLQSSASPAAPPEDSAPRLRLAAALLELGRVDEAETQFRHVRERRPGSAPAALGLGKIADAEDRSLEAAAYLEQAVQDPTTRKAAHRLLASIYERLGRTNEARRLAAVLARLPNDAALADPLIADLERLKVGEHAAIDQADEWIKSGRAAEAAQFLEKTLETYPNSDRALFFLGRAYLRLGETARAESVLQRAIQLEPRKLEAHVQLGIVHLSRGRNAEAQQSFRTAIELKPNLAEAWYNLGLSIGGLDRGESAAAFREAIRLKPSLIEAYLGLAVVLRADRQIEAAADVLQRALALHPDDPLRQRVLDQLKLVGRSPQ